jgi:S-adenosylmethionine:tRNA-ribosyltransferase-isomerase (queuine synthetase)
VGNLYANVVSVPSGTTQEIYVGAGNKLTMVGTTFTVRALGTASSAQSGVYNAAGT